MVDIKLFEIKSSVILSSSASIVTQIVTGCQAMKDAKDTMPDSQFLMYALWIMCWLPAKYITITIFIEIANKNHVVLYSTLILWSFLCNSAILNFS